MTDPKNLELARLLLDEWKFRQEHCWKLFPRYGLTAGAISAIPYLKKEIIDAHALHATLFPIAGFILASIATWLYVAESQRAYSVLKRYREVTLESQVYEPDGLFGELLDRAKVRWVTPSLFLLAFVAITIANLFYLGLFG